MNYDKKSPLLISSVDKSGKLSTFVSTASFKMLINLKMNEENMAAADD